MAKILVVDDDRAILDMIGTILSKDGHLITKVNNPLEINCSHYICCYAYCAVPKDLAKAEPK